MLNYLELMKRVLDNGAFRADRTGVGTYALFGTSLDFDLERGFPAVTTKRLYFDQVCAELAAFLKGATKLSEFHREGCRIWDANARAFAEREPLFVDDESGDVYMGEVYGAAWRHWPAKDMDATGETIDQLRLAVEGIKAQPYSRRHVVTAWNPSELEFMCLPPCHTMYQFFARNDGGLDCAVVMRSVDLFLGMPFDIASYAVLLHLVAKETGRKAKRLLFWFGDTHIYVNHVEQCRLQMSRTAYPLPRLGLTDDAGIDSFSKGDAMLVGYDYHPAIPADMAV